MSLSMLDLSIVIVSWRMKAMLRELLQSIKRTTDGIAYEIIVVDNNSEDGTSVMVKGEFKEAQLIENDLNRGITVSRNQGIRLARGRYVVILDADMILRENSLRSMVQFMDSTPDAGICGCKLVFPDDSVQPSGRRFPTPLAFLLRRLDFLPIVRRSRVLRHHEMSDWDRKEARTVDYVIGACQMVRRTAIEQVGLLDENIFYGPEDIDYCLRMQQHGWKVYYYPHTSIIHYEQRATKRKPFSKLSWSHFKGLVYLFMKYGGRLSYDSKN